MHKTISLLSLLICINFSIFGQQSTVKQNKFSENLRFGGGFSMGFSNNYSTFSISPSIIYDFSDQFSSGVSFSYLYVKNKSTTQKSTSNLYGGSILSFYKPISNIQISSEYERLKLDQKYVFDNDISAWQDALYFGLEYVSGNIAIGLRYDVLYDKTKNFLYASALNPVFRIYF